MRHVIDAIAAQGRDGDTELLHVTKGEIAGLDALARRHFGKNLPRNPRTGIKEASLFRDWFGNDVGTVFDVAAPIAVGMIPGVGMPAAIAMGAGIGAANQGLGKGGTTEGALLGGITGGIGAYGGAGLTESLTAAGTSTAATPAVTGSIANTAPAATSSLAPEISTQAFQQGVQQSAGQGLSGLGNVAANTATPLTDAAVGALPTAPSTLAPEISASTFQQGVSQVPSPTSSLTAGFNKVTESPQAAWDFAKANKGNLMSMGTSGLMTAGIPGAPQTPNEALTGTNSTLPKSEIYYTPYGERRTRIVAAEGGLMSLADGEYGDYDGADEEGNPRRYALGGGISNVGFSKGRYLQGEGDGMSDSIKANIDGKQEARLATGEFIVPADVVSHLGNGDSTAGAKQLHAMMDRARMSRTGTKKQGKQINPRKVMPA